MASTTGKIRFINKGPVEKGEAALQVTEEDIRKPNYNDFEKHFLTSIHESNMESKGDSSEYTENRDGLLFPSVIVKGETDQTQVLKDKYSKY